MRSLPDLPVAMMFLSLCPVFGHSFTSIIFLLLDLSYVFYVTDLVKSLKIELLESEFIAITRKWYEQEALNVWRDVLRILSNILDRAFYEKKLDTPLAFVSKI